MLKITKLKFFLLIAQKDKYLLIEKVSNMGSYEYIYIPFFVNKNTMVSA